MSPGSAFGRVRGQRAGANNGESDREAPAGTAPATVEREPARKKRPARAGAAPREGKALEGSSRDASGMKKGREASGATANGGVQKTSSEPRASRNRREGQEPWGRHRRECGNSRPTRATERERVAEKGHPT